MYVIYIYYFNSQQYISIQKLKESISDEVNDENINNFDVLWKFNEGIWFVAFKLFVSPFYLFYLELFYNIAKLKIYNYIIIIQK